MILKDQIAVALHEAFSPQKLDVIDESHLHEGHGGWREGGQTHFKVVIVSSTFTGLSRLERHRRVNDVLSFGFQKSLHALQITALSPLEAGEEA